MQGFNHVSGGVVFTGIFASFTDVNIFEKPEYIAFTVFCSVLPDIDHTKSLIGKALYPLAKWLNSKFGHRTFTHSIVFLIGFVLAIRLGEILFYKSAIFSVIAFYGILSHDIFDMCTRQGIQFFYPFSKRPAVLPANPNMRLQTNDLRSEAIIFVIFCSLIAFCQPLFANGFWAQYHKSFLTYKAIRQEANRNKELIEIVFIEKGSDTTKALFIAHEETYFVTYDFKDFKKYDVNQSTKFIDFKRTNYLFEIEQKQLLSVDSDTLKKYLKQPILKAQIQSSQDLKYFEGAVAKSSKEITFEYKKGFDFTLEKIDISGKMFEIELLETQKQDEIKSYNNKINLIDERLSSLQIEIVETERLIESGTLYERSKAIDRKKDLLSKKDDLELNRKMIEMGNQKVIDIKIEALKSEVNFAKPVVSANLSVMKLKASRGFSTSQMPPKL